MSAAKTSARPAPDATTIILVREGVSAPEVFMVRRSGGADFFGDAYVFPGGGLDPEDSSAQLLAHSAGLPALDLERLQGEGLSREEAAACWIAGIRELFEEAGIMLAYCGGAMISFADSAVARRFVQYREDLRAKKILFEAIVAREGLRLATDRVHYFSRIVTPPYARKRYDTRFVLAEAPADQLASHDRVEVVSGEWLTPAAAIAQYHSKAQQIVPPTLQNLLELEECKSAAEMIELARRKPIIPVAPTTVKIGGLYTLIYPGDRDFVHTLEPAFRSMYKEVAPCKVLRFVLERGGRWAIAPGFPANSNKGAAMSKPIEQRVQELADREEIKELTARYCWHVARGEGEAVAHLFTDDGLLDVADGSFRAVRGKDDLLKFYRTSVREPEAAVPFIHNHIIEISGDEAHGTCTIDARFIRNGESVIAAGWYNDKYRRVNGRWLFAERKITFHHVAPLKKGWAETKAESRNR
jgi:8-oxo-dGTP pyrophosphatase MutT (NUDIX family)